MVAVETVEYEGSGRGLVAVTPIAAGELVLRESPVILTVTQSLHKDVCAHCLRYITGDSIPLVKGIRSITSSIDPPCLLQYNTVLLLQLAQQLTARIVL